MEGGLEDRSTNGTFVGGARLGKGHTRRLVPGENESIFGLEAIERIEATLENFVGGVVTARHIDTYTHGGSVSVPNL